MAIKNYTTSIDPEKSIAEINKCLVSHGADRIVIDYSDGLATKLIFRCESNGIEMDFSLPCRWRSTLKILQNSNIASKHKTEEQAIRTSWRIIRDWVFAQMALVEIEMVDISEVFLPYAVLKSGETLYDNIMSGKGMKLLEQ